MPLAPPTTAPACELSELVRGANEFACQLYKLLAQEAGNLFVSPLSISSALAMTAAGARTSTETEMLRVLHLANTGDQVHALFGATMSRLHESAAAGPVELTIANGLWGRLGYAFRPSYLELAQRAYDATLAILDFAGDSDKAAARINKWVEKQTRERIKVIVRPNDVQDTRLVLTNAIYFYGDWLDPFEAHDTEEGTFTIKPRLFGAKTTRVPLMSKTADFAYADLGAFQALEIPYLGGQLAMLIALPKEHAHLEQLEQRLTCRGFSHWVSALRVRTVAITIPKFRMEMQESLDLSDPLKAMGMAEAFTDHADFSGATDHPDGLKISKVLHKAFVEVTEKGTEAAAATAVVVRLGCAAPSKIPQFRADHPFIFAIRDRGTGSILFIGRVTNPSV